MNVCQAIVKMLESIGVDAFFTGSGQGPGGIMFALAEAEKLRTIVVKNEQAASFMACGYAMFTNKLGVCNAQGGPGAFNMFSGAAVALSASLPVLSIASYASTKWQGWGDLGESTGLYRTPDQHAMFAATTKKAFILKDPARTCDIVEEAVNTAFEGRPGPVHIDIPTDVMGMDVPLYRDIKLTVKPVLPLQKDVDLFADVLAGAIQARKKILAHIGFGAVRSNAGPELLEFVERFEIPFVTTMDAKGVIPEDHPLSLGMGGISSDPGAKQAYKNADLVIGIGNSFVKWQCWRFQEDLFNSKTLMHINIAREEINKVFKADYSMISDIKPAMAALNKALKGKAAPVHGKAPGVKKHFDEAISYAGPKVHPGLLCRELSGLLPERSIVLGDAGAHMIWLATHMRFTAGQNYKNPGSFGPMAAHINAAVGAQLANPDRRVIVGCGDGAYLMSGFELMTAVEHRIPIVWVILNNSEFNIIKLFHLTLYNREVFNKYPTPDFAAYARVCGANGYRVEKLEEFAPAFKSALRSDMPSVIDVIVDPDIAIPFAFYGQD